MKKKLSLILLLPAVLLLSGCRSLLIPMDTPISTNAGSIWKIDQQEDFVQVTSIRKLGTGTIDYVSKNNNLFLVSDMNSAPPITYNINSYDPSTNVKKSLVSSDKEQYSAVLSNDNSGLFYVAKGPANGKSEENYQLFWTSLDRTMTKTLSSADESIAQYICLSDQENSVFFVDGSGNIVLCDSDGNKTYFQLPYYYKIKEIYYSQKEDGLYFLGNSNTSDENTHLYFASLKDKQLVDTKTYSISCSSIAHNVMYFDVSEDESEIAFVQKFNHSQRLVTKKYNSSQLHVIDKNDNYSAVYSKDNRYLIEVKMQYRFNQTYYSVWILDQETKRAQQLSSSLKIPIAVFTSNEENTIYFSSESVNNYNNNIYQIKYDL